METITVKQWPAGNGLPDFSVRKVANGAVTFARAEDAKRNLLVKRKN